MESVKCNSDGEAQPTSMSICQMPRSRGNRAEILAVIIGCTFLVISFSIPPVKHDHYGSQGLVVQVGVILWFGIVFLLAEILRRLCLFAEEIRHLKTRYNGSKSRLLLFVFSSPYAANLTALIMLLSLLFISHVDHYVMVEIRTHWPTSIGLGGLYLFLLSAVKISENLIDVDIFLDKRVMAIGNGLAYSYYYGFLKIILPAGINKNIQERATHFEDEEKIKLACKKLLILIPDSCFCTPSFQDMAPSGQIERVKTLEDVVVSRAGMKSRQYTATVYRIQPEGKTEPLYVLMEMPAILLILYEMNMVGGANSKLSSFERTQQAQAFYRILSRLLEENPGCKDLYEIIYYKDQEINLADEIYNYIIKMQEREEKKKHTHK